jgi:two-component system, response regulator PdtaR
LAKRVLIVEDDFMIADYLEEILVEAGYEVCGIAGNVADAIALGERHRPSLGVIDMRLGNGELGTAVAAALCPHGGFGVLYATGNSRHPMLDGAQGEACIGKPYTAEAMVAALGIVAGRMAHAPATAHFPPGFRLLGP